MIGHPSDVRLSRFADGDLSEFAMQRVTRHLAHCARCREAVSAIKEIGQRARSLASGDPSAYLRDRILEDVAAGERVIIPGPGSIPTRAGPTRIAWATAAIVVLGVALSQLFDAEELSSEASNLSFDPPRPERGAAIEVTYRSTARLAGLKRLSLRARYRRSSDPPNNIGMTQTTVGELTPENPRLYRGTLQLPNDVVYATFAVENSEASVVDSRGRRGWSVMVYEAGRPSFDAFVQKMQDLEGRDWTEGLETAVQFSDVYPGRPFPWVVRLGHEQELYGAAAHDSLSAVYSAVADRIGSLPLLEYETADDYGWMYFLHMMRGDTTQASYWRDQLLTETPRAPSAVQVRVIQHLSGPSKSDTSMILQKLDEMWDEVGPAHVSLPTEAFNRARIAGDTHAMIRWAQRLRSVEPWQTLQIAERLAEEQVTHDTVLAWIDAEQERLQALDDSRRDLHVTRAEQTQIDNERLRRVHSIKGSLLANMGRTREAIGLLDAAVSGGWDLAVFRRVAEMRGVLGDVRGQAEMHARIAADPSGGTSQAVPQVLNLQEWTQLIERQRETMYEVTLGESVRRRPYFQAAVSDLNGHSTSIASLTDGRPTVITIWRRGCEPCFRDLHEIRQSLNAIQNREWRLVVITNDQPSIQLSQSLRTHGIEELVYYDVAGATSPAYDVWLTPAYLVLDGLGFIRFPHARLEDIPRQVLALQYEANQTGSVPIAQ